MPGRAPSDIADPALAPVGRARVEWAEGQMPVLRSIRERFEKETPLSGIKVAACLQVAAALVDDGVPVLAKRGEDADSYARHVASLAEWGPDITLDDGADLLSLLHRWERDVRGGAEETTTGLLRLRRLEAEGKLRCPVIAVNESRTERTFNDRYGTGQSALDGILRATNLLLAGRTLVLCGYGATGKGISQRARGAGAPRGRRWT